MSLDIPNLKDDKIKNFDQRLRDEANEDLAQIVAEEPTSKTQIIAIYGKGGIGKSFTLANLSHMMAEQGKRVLLIGCDPKSDTTSLLFGGKACPTIIETSTKKKLAGEEVKIGDVCFKRGGVFAMELGGPEVGRGSIGHARVTTRLGGPWRAPLVHPKDHLGRAGLGLLDEDVGAPAAQLTAQCGRVLLRGTHQPHGRAPRAHDPAKHVAAGGVAQGRHVDHHHG